MKKKSKQKVFTASLSILAQNNFTNIFINLSEFIFFFLITTFLINMHCTVCETDQITKLKECEED